jgi:hypothetical protein
LPREAFTAFLGGVQNWGSICGALPPAIFTINLVVRGDRQVDMINELMAWYKATPFPIFQPRGMNLPTTVADSSLCHASVTKFLHVMNVPRNSRERIERCGGLTADVTKFTVTMLNDFVDRKLDTGIFYKPSPIVEGCMACHSARTHGKETCSACHADQVNK